MSTSANVCFICPGTKCTTSVYMKLTSSCDGEGNFLLTVMNETEGEVLSSSTSVNEERINLSKIVSKPYGATTVEQQTLKETLQYKGEQNEGYNSNE
ncbi:hypothetical protein DPX16_5593 [Anabarilius grahami]|uniref:Uncharacterized protein n=1 Tax=Anabarilius grahami TaxID=495550 RepID=A0A3N0YB53_ANAGA|nr:hypothetical protein DPX16_5593 [Anabarilius grahami]